MAILTIGDIKVDDLIGDVASQDATSFKLMGRKFDVAGGVTDFTQDYFNPEIGMSAADIPRRSEMIDRFMSNSGYRRDAVLEAIRASESDNPFIQAIKRQDKAAPGQESDWLEGVARIGENIKSYLEREYSRQNDMNALNEAKNKMQNLLQSQTPTNASLPEGPDVSARTQDAVKSLLKRKSRAVGYGTSTVAGETGSVSGRARKPVQEQLLGGERTLLGG